MKTGRVYIVVYETFLIDFVAGGVAGAVSRTVVSPLERVKIIFQVLCCGVEYTFKFKINSGKQKKTVAGVLKTIWRQEGVLGMFKGNGTNVIRIFPYSAVQFASYEMAKKVKGESTTSHLLFRYCYDTKVATAWIRLNEWHVALLRAFAQLQPHIH